MRNLFSLFATQRRSVIAEEMCLGGDLISRERGVLEIHGRVEGRVIHEGPVIVAATGCCARGIKATAVEIVGEVHGDVEASHRLIIRDSGQLFGDALCPVLVVQPGATFAGSSRPQYLALPAPAAEVLPREREALRTITAPLGEPEVPAPTPVPSLRPLVAGDPDSDRGPLFHGGIAFKG